MIYSNPRKFANFNDWPSGGKRVTCTFAVESHPKKGERVGRTTTGATKYSTYSPKVAIVDGDNGRTYILSNSKYGGGHLSVHDSAFMSHESFFSDHPRYNEMLELLNAADAPATTASV
jgi:hypothetical protein